MTPTNMQPLLEGYRDPVRPVDLEFASYLEVVDQGIRPMPGSWIRRSNVDVRLPNLKLMMTPDGAVGPREGDEIALCEHVAMVRHKQTGHYFVVFRETYDTLLLRQNDIARFPEWLMKHPVKQTELKIYVARVLGKPAGKYDKDWIQFLDEGEGSERVFDAIVYYLLRKGILQEQMYGRG